MNDLRMNRQGHLRRVITKTEIDGKPGRALLASGLQKGQVQAWLLMMSRGPSQNHSCA
jgi:hypothetical protein